MNLLKYTLIQCNYWNQMCATIGDTIQFKKCIGNSMFYLSPIKSRWTMARFYCQSIFNGYQNADLLYLDTEEQKQNFKIFISSISGEQLTYQTSSLCCAHIDGGRVIKKSCSWLNSRMETTKLDGDNYRYALEDAMKNQNECSFLKITVTESSSGKFVDFDTTSEPISSQVDYSFVCSYKKPEHCPDIKTTTTTRRPTTKHVSPTWPVITTETMPITMTTPTITTITTINPSTTTDSTNNPEKIHCIAPNGTKGIDYWPPALPGQNSTAKCPSGSDGIAVWYCESDGQFSTSGPIITCTQNWIHETLNSVKNSKSIEDLKARAAELNENITKQDREMKFHGDLNRMVDVVHEIQYKTGEFIDKSKTPTEEQTKSVRSITKTVVRTCSSMLNSDLAWKNGHKDGTVNIAGSMLAYIQYAGITFGCTEAKVDPNVKLNSISPNQNQDLNIFLSAFNMEQEQPIKFSYQGMNFSLSDSIDNGTFVSNDCEHKIGVGAVFDKLSRYLSYNMNNDEIAVNSEIVAFNYNNETKTFQLPDQTYAEMSLMHQQNLKFGANAICVYWDIKKNSWSSDGCWLKMSASSIDKSICVCNHLTSFSVLMDVSGTEEPSQLKNVLTIVCTVASVICLAITIILYSICRELINRRTTILINLSVSLIFVDFLVLFGLDRVENSILCKCISVTLLYWLLTSFSWMLMEGYQLYQMVILVFNNIGHLRLIYMYLIGYGAPLIITVIATIIIQLQDGLTNEYFCWITSTRHPMQILALIIPATIVIIINTVIMYLVVKKVFNMKFGKGSTAFGSKSNSKSTSSIVSSSPNGDYSQRQRNITAIANGSSSGVSSNESSINSTRRLFEKNGTGNSAVKFADDSTIKGKGKKGLRTMSLDKQMSQWISYVKGYMSLIVLMGITWITYVLYIHQYGHFFSYIFIVLNGLQGVFIFLTQFVFDKKTRTAVQKRLCKLVGNDQFRSNVSTNTKNTVSSAYTTSTRTLANSSSNNSDGSDSIHAGARLNHESDPSSSQSSTKSSKTSSNNQNNELTSIFTDNYIKQRKYSLEYF
ncbi:hypothetical protein BLOT_011006 [Blomia tropicalis]|nr:hypothetical protein BLOT_011006 [Blomia tropicalis]